MLSYAKTIADQVSNHATDVQPLVSLKGVDSTMVDDFANNTSTLATQLEKTGLTDNLAGTYTLNKATGNN